MTNKSTKSGNKITAKRNARLRCASESSFVLLDDLVELNVTFSYASVGMVDSMRDLVEIIIPASELSYKKREKNPSVLKSKHNIIKEIISLYIDNTCTFY